MPHLLESRHWCSRCFQTFLKNIKLEMSSQLTALPDCYSIVIFIYLFVCLFVYLFVCLLFFFVFLNIYLFGFFLIVYLFVYLLFILFICVFVCLFVYLFIYLFILIFFNLLQVNETKQKCETRVVLFFNILFFNYMDINWYGYWFRYCFPPVTCDEQTRDLPLRTKPGAAGDPPIGTPDRWDYLFLSQYTT